MQKALTSTAEILTIARQADRYRKPGAAVRSTRSRSAIGFAENELAQHGFFPDQGGVNMIAERQMAPEFTLENQSGQEVRLSDFRGRWVVLFFYVKDNTSG